MAGGTSRTMSGEAVMGGTGGTMTGKMSGTGGTNVTGGTSAIGGMGTGWSRENLTGTGNVRAAGVMTGRIRGIEIGAGSMSRTQGRKGGEMSALNEEWTMRMLGAAGDVVMRGKGRAENLQGTGRMVEMMSVVLRSGSALIPLLGDAPLLMPQSFLMLHPHEFFSRQACGFGLVHEHMHGCCLCRRQCMGYQWISRRVKWMCCHLKGCIHHPVCLTLIL